MPYNLAELPELSRRFVEDSMLAIVGGRLPNSGVARSYNNASYLPQNYAEILFPHRIFHQQMTEAVANNFRLFLERNQGQQFSLEDITVQRYVFRVKPNLNPVLENSFIVHSEPVYSDPDIWGAVIVAPESKRKDPLVEEYFALHVNLTNVPVGFHLREITNPEDFY